MVECHHPTRSVRLLIAVVAATAGCLVTACQLGGHRDPVPRWALEVVNEADDRVKVQIPLEGFGIPLPWDQEDAGYLVLEPGGRRTFRLGGGLGRDTAADGYRLIWLFAGLDFYDDGSAAPYRSYVYSYAIRCTPSPCDGSHTTRVFVSPDGAEERLFVKSPERPFYLELDKEDLDLGRLVITFVPSAEATAGGG